MIPGLMALCPINFSPTSRQSNSILGVYSIDASTSVHPTSFSLRIAQRGDLLVVSEAIVGSALPESCPERHINPDGTFCIGVDAGANLATEKEYLDWWSLLDQYLQAQCVASRTKVWPIHKGLAHGGAGETQLRTIEIACRMGILDVYERHVTGGETWLGELLTEYKRQRDKLCVKSDNIVRVTEVAKRRILEGVYGRAPRRMSNRKRLSLIRELLETECKREFQEMEFWHSFLDSGATCCHTMVNCPLRRH